MLTHPTVDKLYELRCTGMAKAMAEQLASPQVQNLSFEERLGLLVDRELTERHSRQLTNRLRRARLRHNACIEDIDFRAPAGSTRTSSCPLADGRWVREHLSILIIGPAGIGKSWIACALAHSACRHGHSASYRRLPRLLTELAIARADGSYPKLLALARQDRGPGHRRLRPRQAQRREPPRPARDYRRPLWHPLHCDHQPTPRRELARTSSGPDPRRRHPRPTRAQLLPAQLERRIDAKKTPTIDPKLITATHNPTPASLRSDR